jgi:hypothetical protein
MTLKMHQVRMKAPNRYDRAAYNTIFSVGEDASPTYYIQINEDPEGDAQWLPLGEILLGINKKDMWDEDKRHRWIKQYHIATKEDDE